jgi:hypothetical protein
MSSTAAVLDRPASPALPGPLSPLDPLAFPTEPADSLTPVPASPPLPSLSTILFPDFSLSLLSLSDPTTSPSEDAEASAALPFTIDDLSKASWAASKVLEAQARIADRAELAQAYIEKINSWLSSSSKADEDSVSFLSLLIKPYIESELSRSHSRSRTLHLLTASASLRKGQDHVEILDPDAALSYCETSYPEAVVIKKELSRSVLRRLILSEGTPIPGVEASLGSDSLYLKPRA